MSKADSSPSTAASASKSRRAVILGAGGLAAAGALSAAAKALPATAGLSADHQALIAKIRALHKNWYDLVDYEMSIEIEKGEPGHAAYEAAIAASETAQADREHLCYEILSQPVRSWDDVAVRAELAKTFAEEELGGGLSIVENPSDIGDETLAALLEAALLMGRVEPKARGAHV
jgi:hypothetical protein